LAPKNADFSVIEAHFSRVLQRTHSIASPPYGFMLLPGTSSGFAMKLSSFPDPGRP
jgi:hypothetical protein